MTSDDSERQEVPSTTDADVVAAFARARDDERAGMALAQARVAGALFGHAAATVGRFRVLDRLGAGGMGVVYAAYDPQLDRRVALKMVEVPGRSRDVALREGKALARLSHPNVVPVYDVGITGEHIFIVMELVRGPTLRAWVAGRSRDEILAVYRQAAAGLTAAHGAGLVHRDFKPDNAMVGDDGRVRVVDFGVASPTEGANGPTQLATRRRGGTPQYMSPEQARDSSVTAAADQYSFAVSLREALACARTQTGTLPAWLEAVLARATASQPEDRFGSMVDLLVALERDPARRRRRATAIALAVFVAIGATSVWRMATEAERACARGSERLDEMWSVARQRSALHGLASLGPYGKTVALHLEAALGAYRDRWSAGFRDACRAGREQAHSGLLLDRRMICLERGRSALGALGRLAENSGLAQLPDLVKAVQAAPDSGRCGDLEALSAEVAPPTPGLVRPVAELRRRLEAARVDLAAGRFAQAQAAAKLASARARQLGYRPALAEALVVEGHALMSTARAAAVEPLREATQIAFEVGAHRLGIEAWARRAWAEGTSRADRAALGGEDVLAALAQQLPGAQFERALFHHNRGSVELALEERARGRAAFTTALGEARGLTGPGAIELVNSRIGMAFTSSDEHERDRWFSEAQSALTGLIGADHPDTLDLRTVRSAWATSPDKAAVLLAPICATMNRLHPTLGERTAACWMELAFLQALMGHPAEAVETVAHVARGNTPHANKAAAYLALWQDHARQASTQLSEAVIRLGPIARLEAQPHWIRLEAAELHIALARARRQLGQRPAARRLLATAFALLAPLAEKHEAAIVQRRLMFARAEWALLDESRVARRM